MDIVNQQHYGSLAMQNIVIIGAVALGPEKPPAVFKRLEPESKVTMLDQSDLISYGGCGIPYFVSGDLSDPGQLQSTSFHMIRDEKFFQGCERYRRPHECQGPFHR